MTYSSGTPSAVVSETVVKSFVFYNRESSLIDGQVAHGSTHTMEQPRSRDSFGALGSHGGPRLTKFDFSDAH